LYNLDAVGDAEHNRSAASTLYNRFVIYRVKVTEFGRIISPNDAQKSCKFCNNYAKNTHFKVNYIGKIRNFQGLIAVNP